MLISNILSDLILDNRENAIPYHRVETLCRNYKSKNNQIFHHRPNGCKYRVLIFLSQIGSEKLKNKNKHYLQSC